MPTTTKSTSIRIPRDYAGPPFGANGGYLAGLMAEYLGVRSAHTEMIRPVPLERPVTLVDDGMTASVVTDRGVAARSAPVSLVPRTHPEVGRSAASGAVAEVDTADHPFPECFVCGPRRHASDGLRLLAGTVGDGVSAASWTPQSWQGDSSGVVPVRIVTAALDCPSAAPVLEPGEAALLASMSFAVIRCPDVGEPLVVVGWRRRLVSRKRFASSVVIDSGGRPIAWADTLWIAVDEHRLAGMARSEGAA